MCLSPDSNTIYIYIYPPVGSPVLAETVPLRLPAIELDSSLGQAYLVDGNVALADVQVVVHQLDCRPGVVGAQCGVNGDQFGLSDTR